VVTNFVPADRAHPAFLAADLGAARRQFEAAGVTVRADTQVAHVRRFYVSDPFGNRLEFIQQGDRFLVESLC
jgi:catechol 2,3-dioxygenase-like lactoylglutathione lyase family enzyme